MVTMPRASANVVVPDVAFIGEVDRRLGERGRLDQHAAPALVELRERACRLAQRLAALALCLRVDEIG